MSVLSDAIARLLFVPTLVVAAAFLVRAHAAPGDGFTAGLVAATAFMLLKTGAIAPAPPLRPPPSLPRPDVLGAAGLLLMLVVAVMPMLVGHPPLTMLPTDEVLTLGTLSLGTALLFDLGIALLVIGLAVVTIQRLDPDFAPQRR